MARPLRIAPAGYVYHVFNRANGGTRIFSCDGDYYAFENTLAQACQRYQMPLLTYCAMPNHWHLVLQPQQDGCLSDFMGWLTMTHTQRWHAHNGTIGTGHLYQGRFKSFPVQTDAHFLTLCRYVERNPVSARLVQKAQDWRWSALWHRRNKGRQQNISFSDWPVDRPRRWIKLLNQPFSEKELKAVQVSIQRSRPFGDSRWSTRTSKLCDIASSMRPRGRPRQKKGS